MEQSGNLGRKFSSQLQRQMISEHLGNLLAGSMAHVEDRKGKTEKKSGHNPKSALWVPEAEFSERMAVMQTANEAEV